MIDEKVALRSRILCGAGMPSPLRVPFEPDERGLNTVSHHRFAAAPNCLALISTRNFVPFAKLTARTFLAHHPEFRAFLLLVDGEPDDAAKFDEGEVVFLSDLELDHVGWHAAKFTASEFSNALKPAFLRYLANFTTNVVYLDCDIAVFSRLTEMIDLLTTRDLVLIPHMLAPPPRPEQFWTHPTRADIFNSGLINAGGFAIKPTQCREFLAFWEEANLAPGAFYEGAGYQTDQQHLNWALVTMPGACVLRESRYNVAYWNLHERDFRVESVPGYGKQFQVDRKPLAFFHFSGYDVYERLRLSRHDQRHSVYNLPSVAEILNWYSDQILSCPMAGMLHEPYRFDRLANGFQLNRLVRELLKRYEVYFPKFDARKQADADKLCAFLMDPLPATGSMLPLLAAQIYESRPDLQKVYPGAHTEPSPSDFWRWFCRHAGDEYEIHFLVDRFRRVLISNSIAGFAEVVAKALDGRHTLFLGPDRIAAANHLRALGENGVADMLLEAREEWYFFADLSAAFEIYLHRPDLQKAFPDILDQNHAAFSEWLTNHGPEEHGCPPTVGERFRRCAATASLARVFSYLARREDVARACQDSLLSDDPGAALRHLIRGAGEGLEYDLDDVIVLRFIHQTARHLLVPLYLELPLVRMRPHASRIAEASMALLPENLRGSSWALLGCQAHAQYFDRFEAYLDREMRRWADTYSSPPREVLGFLRGPRRGHPAIKLLEPAYRAAARQLNTDAATSDSLGVRLKERDRQPGVNLFGYFHSDIGIGESSRGLALALSLLRPVNRVPLCTAQVREGTRLPDLFQCFAYLSDTNVFVSYPHQGEDLFGMIRPEQLVARRNIAHLAWEQEDANPWWQIVYDRYDEIWVISEFAATPFRKMFPGRVRVVPNVLDFDQFPQSRQTRLGGELLTFLFVFDANSAMERKNPEGVIDAFAKAFKGTPNATRVQLILKVGGMHRAEHATRIEALVRRAHDTGLAIKFDGRQLTREAMLQLIAQTDCYVSLHRAEGFGYTMAEAMYYGVPVIASGYSGNLEYMTPANSFLVPCKEAFVQNPDGPFQRGSIWGEPDIEVAASLMRQVAEKPADALAVGELGRQSVTARLSPAAISETIRSCFGAVPEEHRPLKALVE